MSKSIYLSSFATAVVFGALMVSSSPVVADSTNSIQVIERVAPDYPRRAAMAGVEGFVELEFTVTSDGRATDIRVIQAEPRRVFDRAATDALGRWEFATSEANKSSRVRINFNI